MIGQHDPQLVHSTVINCVVGLLLRTTERRSLSVSRIVSPFLHLENTADSRVQVGDVGGFAAALKLDQLLDAVLCGETGGYCARNISLADGSI